MSLLALFVWGVCSSLGPGSHPDHPAVCGGLGDRDDWLVAGCSTPSTVAVSTLADGSTQYLLSNGVVSRTCKSGAPCVSQLGRSLGFA